jgi:CRISPR/Cas system-associated endoribonuclease Cas2
MSGMHSDYYWQRENDRLQEQVASLTAERDDLLRTIKLLLHESGDHICVFRYTAASLFRREHLSYLHKYEDFDGIHYELRFEEEGEK